MSKRESLGPQERRALIAMYEVLPDKGPGYGTTFAAIAEQAKLSRDQTRRAVRSLARKGLTEYLGPLWHDDGTVNGSGYGLTARGRQAAEQPS